MPYTFGLTYFACHTGMQPLLSRSKSHIYGSTSGAAAGSGGDEVRHKSLNVTMVSLYAIGLYMALGMTKKVMPERSLSVDYCNADLLRGLQGLGQIFPQSSGMTIDVFHGLSMHA